MSELVKEYVKDKKEFFIISDLHFNHANIIKYCNRPYDNVAEMNQALIDNWNKVVGDDDLVLVLGDIGFGNREVLYPLIEQLKGYIVLLLGNHDRRNTKAFWSEIVDEVVTKPFQVQGIIFSHEPVDCPNEILNIHGHLHGNREENINNHVDMSVECHDYTPSKIKLF
jgi:calcineurin-like phosphoesterase family protein